MVFPSEVQDSLQKPVVSRVVIKTIRMGIQNLLIDGFMLVSETPQRVANPWPFVLLSFASIACYLFLNVMLYVLSESRLFKLDISYRILLLFLRNCDLLSLIRQWSLLLINFCGPVPVTNWQIIYVVSGLPEKPTLLVGCSWVADMFLLLPANSC